jgi:hypothetical protein
LGTIEGICFYQRRVRITQCLLEKKIQLAGRAEEMVVRVMAAPVAEQVDPPVALAAAVVRQVAALADRAVALAPVEAEAGQAQAAAVALEKAPVQVVAAAAQVAHLVEAAAVLAEVVAPAGVQDKRATK